MKKISAILSLNMFLIAMGTVFFGCQGGAGSPVPPPGLSPNIEPPTAPPATVGVPYNLSFRWTINTAKPPFFWNLVGSMPPGLQFEPANGRIYGTPTTPGNYAFTMVVRDSNIPSAQESRNYTIVVNGAPGPVVITSPPPA
ncbi:MAG: Ig domain-containing protein, partial [bacterium JZ-2024 1]